MRRADMAVLMSFACDLGEVEAHCVEFDGIGVEEEVL